MSLTPTPKIAPKGPKITKKEKNGPNLKQKDRTVLVKPKLIIYEMLSELTQTKKITPKGPKKPRRAEKVEKMLQMGPNQKHKDRAVLPKLNLN